MPSGGQIAGSSPGLRLQPSFPGIPDSGHANITGTMTATLGNFTGPDYNGHNDTQFIGQSNPGNPFVPVVIGDQANIRWLGPGNNPIYGPVCIGAMAFIGQNNGTINNGPIAIGSGASTSTLGGVAIGRYATCGGASDSGSTGGTVVGNQSAIVNYGGYSSGPGICIGNFVVQSASVGTTHGSYTSTLIGAAINCSYGDPGYAIGGNICITACQGIFHLTDVKNAIIIDTDAANGYALKDYTTADNNSIQIGDTTHTKVKIGGRDITNAGMTRTVADVATTATNQDGAIIYSSITAARIVTLPAANTCPLGFRLLVLDQSGSASGVNTITLTRAGADTVNGGTTAVINTAYGYRELITDGVSKWTQIR